MGITIFFVPKIPPIIVPGIAKKAPKTRALSSALKEINSLFVNLANSSKSYASFSKLLKEFNVNVKLVSVEKVFSERLKKSPFMNEFKQIVPNSNPRVMYNVGMATFYIVK